MTQGREPDPVPTWGEMVAIMQAFYARHGAEALLIAAFGAIGETWPKTRQGAAARAVLSAAIDSAAASLDVQRRILDAGDGTHPETN